MPPDQSATQHPALSPAEINALQTLESWFRSRQWTVFPFQLHAWQNYLAGHSGLIHATTGTGKTLAAWLGPVAEALAEAEQH
ncbi:MAG: hypothetical protein ACKPJJ_26075, partial [Planctomycetaceae bacterium]